mgnify:FL=1
MTLSVQVYLYDNETCDIVREESYKFLNPESATEVFESANGYVYSQHGWRGNTPVDPEWEEIKKEYESLKEDE